jgi:hypothetical protein
VTNSSKSFEQANKQGHQLRTNQDTLDQRNRGRERC